MTNEPQRHEVNISFTPASPRQKKIHRVRDICWITLAAGLIGTVFHSSVVFAVVAAACIVAYVVGGPPKPPNE
jgi:tagatose-1,6-bisphosphate aldolase